MLSQAKRNVKSQYLVVGVMEDLIAFMDVLETIMPHFFRGALHIYRQKGKKDWLHL